MIEKRLQGSILLTTLVILMLMTTSILVIYDTLITMEKVLSAARWQAQHLETIRKKGLVMINQHDWPSACFHGSPHRSSGCFIDGTHYLIIEKYPSRCSVIKSNDEWWNARFYQLWVWEDNQIVGYFFRIAKPDQKLTCRHPWLHIQARIQGESAIQMESIPFN